MSAKDAVRAREDAKKPPKKPKAKKPSPVAETRSEPVAWGEYPALDDDK